MPILDRNPEKCLIGGIELPIKRRKTKFVPGFQEILGQKDTLFHLAYAIKLNLPVLLIGETGVGKTALIRYLAYKTKHGLRRMNLNGQTTTDEFVGKILLGKRGTYWVDGVLIDAMRKGYWLLLDEINAALPEILFVLHSLLDDDHYVVLSEHRGEIVRPHPNFRFFASMNPSGKYAGTKDLNKALLSRFPIVLQIGFPSPKHELEILNNYVKGVDPEVGKKLISVADQLRDAYQKGSIEYLCSTRDLINTCSFIKPLGLPVAITLGILNRAAEEDRKAIETVLSLQFGKGKITKTEASPVDTPTPTPEPSPSGAVYRASFPPPPSGAFSSKKADEFITEAIEKLRGGMGF